jgi:hypothetical protein
MRTRGPRTQRSYPPDISQRQPPPLSPRASRPAFLRSLYVSEKWILGTTYLITNLSFEEADAAKVLQMKTDYWAIENEVHYVADFVFG